MGQFERWTLLIKEEGLTFLQKKRVLIIGVGGVGSYAVESLVRSGIGSIFLVDHDTIDITNLNRQLMALHSNIGMPKVEVWKNRIKEINPDCEVTTFQTFMTEENLEPFFKEPIDFVIDACDSVKTKFAILTYCQEHKIPLISAMGTGNKLDPTMLEITTIEKTSYDPLAKRMRKYAKDHHYHKVMVVFSREQPIATGTTTIASTAFVPATAGLLCASHVIKTMLKEADLWKNN